MGVPAYGRVAVSPRLRIGVATRRCEMRRTPAGPDGTYVTHGTYAHHMGPHQSHRSHPVAEPRTAHTPIRPYADTPIRWLLGLLELLYSFTSCSRI